MSLGKATILLKYDDTNAWTNKKNPEKSIHFSTNKAWGIQRRKAKSFLYSPYHTSMHKSLSQKTSLKLT